MAIYLSDSVCAEGDAKKPNEDLIITENGLFVVLDGATGLGRQVMSEVETDACWFVKEFGKRVTGHWFEWHDFGAALNLSISELEKLMHEISGKIKIKDYEIPSAGMAAVVVEDDLVVSYRTGDCQVYLANTRGAGPVFPESPLERLDSEIMEILSEHIRAGDSHAQAKEKILPRMQALRASMNQDGGYAVLSPDTNCLGHVQRQTIDVTKPGYLLLTTDGFSVVLDKFNRYSIEELFERLSATGLQGLLDEIREIENTDPNLERYPRLKISDDASALLLKME